MVDGIYIHIPFCIKKCGYCDFLSFQSNKEEQEIYIKNIIKEIRAYPKIKYDTIYFGGGTPSILNPSLIEDILTELTFDENTEITLEVNPATVDEEKLKKLKNIGINRLSIGFQSFNENFLKKLGRVHTLEEGLNTYHLARKVGFNNISIDLMFSLPNETSSDLKKDLSTLFSLNPEHFSIYSLIWEEGTEFYNKLLNNEYQETDNEIEADMYELIISEAHKHNYTHYEISNFCKEGRESRHNIKYWENREYIGVGLGASGYYKNIRYKNYSDFYNYYSFIEKGLLPYEEKESISKKELEEYRHILGLRILTKGIIPSKENHYKNIYNELIKNNFLKELISTDEKRYVLTNKGLFLANEVFEKFID